MTKADLPKVGERHPAGIAGMYAVTGETVSGPSGWHRRDTIFIGDKEVGAVHVREAHSRVTAITECQGEYVIGKDAEWVARKCSYTPSLSDAEVVRMSRGWPDPRSNLAPPIEPTPAASAASKRRGSARP